MTEGGQTPVVLFVFRRPEATRQAVEAIAAYQPRTLYVIADGPRNDREAALRQEVLDLFGDLTWPVSLHIEAADTNMGVRQRISSGLDRVFERETEAIILEDDCIADADFFRFCDSMLARYRTDDRIMHIGGNNFQQGNRTSPYSYYFSRHTHCWGWATWRRAWSKYDHDLKHWETFRKMRGMADVSNDTLEEDYFMRCVQSVVDGSTDSWAYIWGYSCLLHHALAIVPEVNLVKNIGFDQSATHTRGEHWFSSLPTSPLGEITHPPCIVRNRLADAITFETHFGGSELRRQFCLHRRLLRTLPGVRRRLKRYFGRSS